MKANKRIRDPRRKSNRRLYVIVEGVKTGTTTMPIDSGPKANNAQDEPRSPKLR